MDSGQITLRAQVAGCYVDIRFALVKLAFAHVVKLFKILDVSMILTIIYLWLGRVEKTFRPNSFTAINNYYYIK